MSNFQFQIIPAVLAITEEEYKGFINKINASNLNGIDWIHIDFMDNKFVQNLSIIPEILDKYKIEPSLKLEAHLMVEDPKSWIKELVKVDSIKRVVFHIEIKKDIEEVVSVAKEYGLEVGLAVNPDTPVKLEQFINMVDIILIMGVHPGFQGQEFIPETINRIKEFSQIRSKNNAHFLIEVDGGISEANIREIADAGTDIAIVGSGLFKYDNLNEGLEKIRKALDE